MLGSFRAGAPRVVAALVFALFAAGAIAARPGAQDDDTRNLWDTGFAQKRPKAKASGQSRKPARYRRATPPLAEQLPWLHRPPVIAAGRLSRPAVIWR